MADSNITLLDLSEHSSSYDEDETLGSLVFFTVVYVLVLISGLVGNFIVIFVILKNNDLKHFTNYFFANLSAADVFVLIFCIPTAIHDIWAKDQWYLGKFFCLINQYVESCATSVSSLTITAISFERFIAICEPFRVHDIFNETLTLATIILIWAIGLIFSLPFSVFVIYDSAFNPTDSLNNTSNLITICHLNANSSAARACITWFIVALIFIPFFVLTFIYARIILELARHRAIRLTAISKTRQQQQQSYNEESNSLTAVLPSNNDNQQSNSFLAYKRFEQKRLNTVIICVVTVAFFACQFPVRTIQLIDMYVRVRNEKTMSYMAWIWLWKLSKLLFFLNFTANPIIYNILSTKFRRSCRRLFQFHPARTSMSSTSRKTSITSYLYSSIYRNRRRQNSSQNPTQQYCQNKNDIFVAHHKSKRISLKRMSLDCNQAIMSMNNNLGKEQIIFNDSESRDLVTVGSNEEILIPVLNTKRSCQSFQVLTEELDENIR